MKASMTIALTGALLLGCTCMSWAKDDNKHAGTNGPAQVPETRPQSRRDGRHDPTALLTNPKTVKLLELSDEQLAAIKSSGQLKQEQVKRHRQRLEKAALKQARALSADAIDEAAFMRCVDDAGAARAAMGKARARHLLDVMQTLTPEQRDRMHKLRRQFRENRNRRRKDFHRRREERNKQQHRAPPEPPGEHRDDADR